MIFAVVLLGQATYSNSTRAWLVFCVC